MPLKGLSIAWTRPLKGRLKVHLSEIMQKLCPLMIECPERPNLLERRHVDEDTLDDMHQSMATCAQSLLRTGRTRLVFLPGEQVEKKSCGE